MTARLWRVAFALMLSYLLWFTFDSVSKKKVKVIKNKGESKTRNMQNIKNFHVLCVKLWNTATIQAGGIHHSSGLNKFRGYIFYWILFFQLVQLTWLVGFWFSLVRLGLGEIEARLDGMKERRWELIYPNQSLLFFPSCLLIPWTELRMTQVELRYKAKGDLG